MRMAHPSRRRSSGWRLLALGAAACACLAPAAAQSVGDLLVAPTRIVIEGRRRTAEVTLVNVGRTAATYRISLAHQRMTETGSFEPIETPQPGEQFADNLVRFSPRQVTLEPRVAQTVRVQLRKPAELAAGEYRSHLLFRAIPLPAPATPPDEEQAPPGGISIKLTPVYGVSIPLIVRHGETSATVSLTEPEVVPGANAGDPTALKLRMNRSGNRSTYGDLVATFRAQGGAERTVSTMIGVAVYTPNPSRVIRLPLRLPGGVKLEHGVLHLAYRAKPEDGRALLAEAELALP